MGRSQPVDPARELNLKEDKRQFGKKVNQTRAVARAAQICTDIQSLLGSVDVGHVYSLCIFSFSAGPFCVLKAVIDFEHEAPDFFVRLLGAVQPSIIITSRALRKTAESLI